MKRFITIIIVTMALVTAAMAGDAVEPASTNVVNTRGEGELRIGGSYFRGTTLLLTNCYMFADGGSMTQYLDGVTVEISVGNSTFTNVYTGTVYASSAAYTDMWWQAISVPELTGKISVQTKITDVNTNIFIYDLKPLSTQVSL